ncbi:MAG: patatin-like phospholipase family protein [Phycisphaerales bacterium]
MSIRGFRRLMDWSGGGSKAGAVALAISAVALAGCAGGAKRPVMTEAELQQESVADLREMAGATQVGTGKLFGRVTDRIEASPDGQTTIHILAMSGGGDYGAFGAGFLVGWGNAQDPSAQRPDFDFVSGVSTGALLAPFAYLGTDEACLQVEEFYRNPKKDWMKQNGMIPVLPGNASLMKIPGLERDIQAVFDDAFIAKMAARSREGKVLAISATDLDLGRQKFWDAGEEAERIDAGEADADRMHRILLASAAIPSIFPPIEIDGSLYADGGVTANVLLRLDPNSPNGFINRWAAAYPDRPLPRVRYWVIINNQLTHAPKTVQPRWMSILGPALETSIRSGTLAEVRWLAAEADYTKVKYDADIEVRVVGIPDDWRAPVSGDFQQETMYSLSEVGRQMGADPNSWQLWTTPQD